MTITASIIADSFNSVGQRLTTLQLRYPRFIHAEFMTHRVFSRNASSSRAIPVSRLIEEVLNDPAMPIHWGKNQPGMQAREENSRPVFIYGEPFAPSAAWLRARKQAVLMAWRFSDANYHKQIINRLLEPFSHINVLVTATEWDNFFALRLHPDAQPEIQELARVMKEAMDRHTPEVLEVGEWHLPYINREELRRMPDKMCADISAARCARVSYFTHNGEPSDIDADLDLAKRLSQSKPAHASPFEHQAIADPYNKYPGTHGNFVGWAQNRKLMEI